MIISFIQIYKIIHGRECRRSNWWSWILPYFLHIVSLSIADTHKSLYKWFRMICAMVQEQSGSLVWQRQEAHPWWSVKKLLFNTEGHYNDSQCFRMIQSCILGIWKYIKCCCDVYVCVCMGDEVYYWKVSFNPCRNPFHGEFYVHSGSPLKCRILGFTARSLLLECVECEQNAGPMPLAFHSAVPYKWMRCACYPWEPTHLAQKRERT